jgi:hypothetical protein
MLNDNLETAKTSIPLKIRMYLFNDQIIFYVWDVRRKIKERLEKYIKRRIV